MHQSILNFRNELTIIHVLNWIETAIIDKEYFSVSSLTSQDRTDALSAHDIGLSAMTLYYPVQDKTTTRPVNTQNYYTKI